MSNQPERAIADVERALKLAPKAPLAYFVRAGGEAKLGQYDKAIADYDEVLRLNPNAEPPSMARAATPITASAITIAPSPTTMS